MLPIDKLKRTMDSLPFLDETIGSLSEIEWKKHCNELKQLVEKDDPYRFISWGMIVGNMFAANNPYVAPMLNYLMSHPKWSFYQEVIRENWVGAPEEYYRFPSASGNTIMHTAHLSYFEDMTGLNVDKFTTIVEFGGGYGSQARIAKKMGFKGRYIIFDLPHFSALQKFYLDSGTITGMAYANTIEELRVEVSSADKSNMLFLSTWALTEAPFDVRDKVLDTVKGCKAYLFAYNPGFYELDNNVFFFNWRKSLRNIQWYNFDIPGINGTYYLMGMRKAKGESSIR